MRFIHYDQRQVGLVAACKACCCWLAAKKSKQSSAGLQRSPTSQEHSRFVICASLLESHELPICFFFVNFQCRPVLGYYCVKFSSVQKQRNRETEKQRKRKKKR